MTPPGVAHWRLWKLGSRGGREAGCVFRCGWDRGSALGGLELSEQALGGGLVSPADAALSCYK